MTLSYFFKGLPRRGLSRACVTAFLVVGLSACGGGSGNPETGYDGSSGNQEALLNVGPVHPFPVPERLLGMSAEGLLKALGTPGLKRQDPPAELWQYRDQRCALNLYLYPPHSHSGPVTVDHYHVVSADKGKISPKDCIYSLTTGYDPRHQPQS